MYAELDVAWCTNRRMRVIMNSFGCGKSRKQIFFFSLKENFVYFYFAPLLCKNFFFGMSGRERQEMWVAAKGKRPIHTHYYNLNLNLAPALPDPEEVYPLRKFCSTAENKCTKKRKLSWKCLFFSDSSSTWEMLSIIVFKDETKEGKIKAELQSERRKGGN